MAEPSPRAKQPTPPPTGPKLVDYTPDPLDEPGRDLLRGLLPHTGFRGVDERPHDRVADDGIGAIHDERADNGASATSR